MSARSTARRSARSTAFVERGGVLLRFAGSRLAAGNDDLVPVRLRRGGRNLGGTLSWDTPRTFSPFTRESPFFGLPIPADLGVRRQILAEPDGDLAEKTWAALQDGTPIVTAGKRGEGLLVLFHVTADTTWSNLPLSGLFVDMLRRVVGARRRRRTISAPRPATPPPRRSRRGSCSTATAPTSRRRRPPVRSRATTPSARRTSIRRASTARSIRSLAVNALATGDKLAPLDLAPLNALVAPLAGAKTIDLRAPLFTAALLALLVDTLASLWLSGHLANLFGRMRRAGSAAAIAPRRARASWSRPMPARRSGAPAPPPLPQDSLQSALVTRLAYVVTGDAQTDATSKAGLVGLTQVLASRTALEPGEPIGIDLARDELAFYPLLYWPIVAEPAAAERGRDPPPRRLHEGRRHRHLRHPRRHERAPGRGADARRASICGACWRPSTSPSSSRCRATTS